MDNRIECANCGAYDERWVGTATEQGASRVRCLECDHDRLTAEPYGDGE